MFTKQRILYGIAVPLLFANGYYRKLRQIDQFDEYQRTQLCNTDPVTYTTAMCIAASHHVVLFPYHIYMDAIRGDIETREYTKHNFIINFLYN